MTNTVIKVENLSKRYRLGELHKQTGSFREKVSQAFNRMAHSQKRKAQKPNPNPSLQDSMRQAPGAMRSSTDDTLWALRKVSFEIKQGEVVGIIGRNGAGKSTLLKILSRITKPTEGRAWVNGQVRSLLEVGTGFHAELTGRENIFLNGAILGMSKAEIKNKFNEIVNFSEIEKFIDTPVKRYSSGMYVRLAFSVAAYLDPDILLVDEVLAVGDSEFQKKCIGKMSEAVPDKKTVLFVSHNIVMIERLCQKVMVLKDGKIDFLGAVSEGTERYFSDGIRSKNKLEKQIFSGTFSESISINSIELNGKRVGSINQVSPSEHISFRIHGYAYKNISRCTALIAIEKKGVRIVTLRDTESEKQLNKGAFCSVFSIPPFLLRPGVYTFSAGVSSHKLKMWLWGRDLGQFIVKEQRSDHYTEEDDGIINISYSGKRTQNKEFGSL